MHGLTPRLHGSPACLPGPSLLYCDHGPRSPSSLSAAVTSGTGRAALFLPSNALVSRVSPRCGYDMPQQRRRRCRASQGMKKGRRPRRRPRLKLSDRAGPDQCPVPGENALFPAQIAGFLAVSRPVPVYPVFLNYVVPVHQISQIISQTYPAFLNLPRNPQRCRSRRRWNSHSSHRSALPGLPHEWNHRERRQTASQNCSACIPARHLG